MADTKKYEPRLKTEYHSSVSRKAMQEKFGYTQTSCRCPRLDKIVINMGVGESDG